MPFYVMEYVAGRVLTDERLPGVAPKERTAIWTSAVQVLAALHSVDFRAVGLERHGKVGGGGDAWPRAAPTTNPNPDPSPNPSPNPDPIARWSRLLLSSDLFRMTGWSVLR